MVRLHGKQVLKDPIFIQLGLAEEGLVADD